MMQTINSTLLISCLFSLCLSATTAKVSLRGQHRRAGIDRYSVSGGGGGASGAFRASSRSPKGQKTLAILTSEVLAATTNPVTAELVTGTDDAQYLGYSVSYAGDVNGDGIGDVIVGDPLKSFDRQHSEVGAAFVIFGKAGLLPDVTSIDLLDGTNGFAVYGSVVNDKVGFSVSYAGDMNGDGFSDIIIGAPGVDAFGVADAGQAYVIFGTNAGFPAVVDLSSLDGTNGFIIQGNSLQDFLGSSVAYAGDLNGDGLDDVVVGAPNAGRNVIRGGGGEAYVIFGSTAVFPSVVFITSLDGSNGFVIESETSEDVLGPALSNAGDINGDGISDIVVSATSAANNEGLRTGASYVIFGTTTGFPDYMNLTSLDGTNGFKINGPAEFDEFGHSLAALGDVNGDGVDDFIIGCPRCKPEGGNFYSGKSYIFYGNSGPMSPTIEATSADVVVQGKDTFEGVGETVSSAGDVNGDGIPDILIGAGRGLGDQHHAIVFVVYGSSSGLPSLLDGQLIEDSTVGVAIPMFPADFVGNGNGRVISVTSGDINMDGISDLIIGLPEVELENGVKEGQVKVVLGNHALY